MILSFSRVQTVSRTSLAEVIASDKRNTTVTNERMTINSWRFGYRIRKFCFRKNCLFSCVYIAGNNCLLHELSLALVLWLFYRYEVVDTYHQVDGKDSARLKNNNCIYGRVFELCACRNLKYVYPDLRCSSLFRAWYTLCEVRLLISTYNFL